MKKYLIGLFTVTVVLLSVPLVWAEPTPWLTGPFQTNPGGMHPQGVSGKMTLLFEGKDFASVQLDLDRPVMGKTRYMSVEQVLYVVPRAEGGNQVALAYKLGGPPHHWYFVVIANSVPAIAIQTAYNGTLCKVPAGSLAEVSERIKNGVDAIPADWKVVGKVNLADSVF